MAQSPFVEVENTSIPPGGRARVTVVASNATEAKMNSPAGAWKIEYGSIDPSPRITRKSVPPIWEWDSPQPEVTIEASLYAPEGEYKGEHYYSVAVRNREEETDDWIREGGVVTITE